MKFHAEPQIGNRENKIWHGWREDEYSEALCPWGAPEIFADEL